MASKIKKIIDYTILGFGIAFMFIGIFYFVTWWRAFGG